MTEHIVGQTRTQATHHLTTSAPSRRVCPNCSGEVLTRTTKFRSASPVISRSGKSSPTGKQNRTRSRRVVDQNRSVGRVPRPAAGSRVAAILNKENAVEFSFVATVPVTTRDQRVDFRAMESLGKCRNAAVACLSPNLPTSAKGGQRGARASAISTPGRVILQQPSPARKW